jgi:hypothetical protein
VGCHPSNKNNYNRKKMDVLKGEEARGQTCS